MPPTQTRNPAPRRASFLHGRIGDRLGGVRDRFDERREEGQRRRAIPAASILSAGVLWLGDSRCAPREGEGGPASSPVEGRVVRRAEAPCWGRGRASARRSLLERTPTWEVPTPCRLSFPSGAPIMSRLNIR